MVDLPFSPDPSIISSPEFEIARRHVALALDVGTLDEAVALANLVAPYVGTLKIGLELYLAEGRASVSALGSFGLDLFLDLKLHDIPTTVERGARVVGGLGVRMVTVHTLGGQEMLEAAVAGLETGAASVGCAAPLAVGVTVLTSDSDAPGEELARRAALAARAGCGAFVCAAPDLGITRAAAPGLVAVVPGTRPAGSRLDDQRRSATPAEALAEGADLLVVGRPITRANDPAEAAYALAVSLIGPR